MQFLYPSFLFALGSLVIPVVVHLFNFRRYQKVQFSNVHFLKELQEQQASRRNLKERLILATRLLALFFLVLAFTRPFIPRHTGTAAGSQNVVSIFVDNSYSMQVPSREGSLLDQARQKAKEIAAAYSINDRFQLLTQDFEGKHERLLSREEFNTAVDDIKISAQSRSMQQILNRQFAFLNEQPNASKSVYILSDMQRNMAGSQAVNTDKNIRVNLLPLKGNSLPNVAVDSVWLLSAVHRPDEGERLVVKLHNYAEQEAKNIPLKLFINGVQKALGSFTIKPRGVVTDTLSFSGLKAGWQRGEIQLQDNPVTFDNQFYFTFNVKQNMPVLLIDGGAENVFLKAAFNTDSFFKADRTPEGNVNYAGLNEYPLIVLSDITSVSAGLAQQLQIFVKKGGSLAIFPAVNADEASYRRLLQPMGAGVPGKLVTEDTRVGSLNVQNPLFRNMFESAPHNLNLPVVKKYYALSAAGNSESIMQLPGGQAFWAGYRSGNGHVYVSAVPLNDDFSNLQRHGLFVPVLFRIALLSGRDMPTFYTLGDTQSIETIPLQYTEKQPISLNKSGYSIIPDLRQQEGSTLLYVSDQLRETGIYELKKQDSIAAVLAFNDDRKESDLSYLTGAELDKLIPGKAKTVLNDNLPVANVLNEVNNGTQLWKLCLILVLVFLAAETLLIRFYKTDKQVI